MGKRKDHIKVAEGLARGLSKREAVRQAGYSDSTAEKKASAIVNRPLVQSALTEALERQGVTFDQILKPLMDALGATLVARTLKGLVQTTLPDHRIRLEAHDRAIRPYGGTPRATEIPPPPAPGLVVIIERDKGPSAQQKPVDVTPKTKIQPYGVSTMPPLPVRIMRDTE